MLYPLSYRGALPMSRDVSMLTAIRVNRTRMTEADFVGTVSKSKRPTLKGAVSWFVTGWFELRRARVFGGFRENPATI